MDNVSRVTQYDYDTIVLPACLLFQNDTANPKRMYTVTRKRINKTENRVEIYLLELDSFETYDPQKMQVQTILIPN